MVPVATQDRWVLPAEADRRTAPCPREEFAPHTKNAGAMTRISHNGETLEPIVKPNINADGAQTSRETLCSLIREWLVTNGPRRLCLRNHLPVQLRGAITVC